jgi:hypothetical protein
MLNRVGQKLLQSFGGAAAAYSLRNLASNIASVVRVRRASDNSERDFSAEDISSGAMTEWVNSQIVPPLDIRELDANGERTGALVEAAAAYSLRNLSSSYTGSVVEVRRSSDGEEDSFTAADVADGTLEDWVNTDLGITFETAEPTTNGATVTNASSTGFTFSSSDTLVRGARLPFSQSIPAGATISVTIRTSNKVGGVTPSVRLASESSGQLAVSATPGNFTSSANGTQTFVGTTISNTTSLAFFDNVVGSFDVSDVTINYIKYDGFVAKWYDQSGNANHATQGTDASQPQIVDGGSLVSGGLDFDGSNDGLSVSGQVLTSSSFYAASVVQHATGTTTGTVQTIHGQYQAATSGRFQLSANNSSEYAFFANATDSISGLFTGAIGTSQTLISANGDGSNAEIWRDGTSKATDTYSGFTPATVDFTIGNDSDGEREFNGKIAEIIIYPSDQSDNRTAIEANIGEVYSIDLPSGVDTGYDQVDGFVETWYDQSGNGIDLSQSVSSRQPLIVNAGTLVTNPEGSPSIECESTGHWLESGGNNTVGSDFSIYAVWTTPPQLSTLLGYDTNRHMIRLGDDALRVTINLSSTPYLEFTDLTEGETTLVNINKHSDTISANFNSTISSGTATLSGTFVWNRIFNRSGAGASYNDYTGKASEIIVYPSDQSANRPAIEANINNQYDIYA